MDNTSEWPVADQPPRDLRYQGLTVRFTIIVLLIIALVGCIYPLFTSAGLIASG